MSSAGNVEVLLLLLVSIGLISAVGGVVLYFRRVRRTPMKQGVNVSSADACVNGAFLLWPGCWLAVKSHSMRAVQDALGLLNPKSCSWLDGLSGEDELFIAPPVRGWIVVTGGNLPDPGEDVDACFRFVLALSGKFRHVQFYAASRLSGHHAWVKADNGRMVRAYAWAGKTLWNQGNETSAERELGLRCYAYTEPGENVRSEQLAEAKTNVERLPLLAARWGFDPKWIDERTIRKPRGILGQLSQRAGEPSRGGRHSSAS